MMCQIMNTVDLKKKISLAFSVSLYAWQTVCLSQADV